MLFSPMEQFDLVSLYFFDFFNPIFVKVQFNVFLIAYYIQTWYIDPGNFWLWNMFFEYKMYYAYLEIATGFEMDERLSFLYFFKGLLNVLSTVIITNYFVYLFITLFFLTCLFFFTIKFSTFYPSIHQFILESIYGLCLLVVKEQAGLRGIKYLFIFIFLFVFILTSNFLGLLPFSFTTTSLLFQNFYLAFSLFLGIFFLALVNLGYDFINLFLPKGVPSWLLPLLFVIEVISYISRPISLSVRLFANMLAGHSLLFILSSFVVSMINNGSVFYTVPLLIIIPIVLLEIGIAGLQAYVFTILSAIYLNSALYKH